MEPHRGKQRASTRGRKDEEFVADFCLVARRALSDCEHKLFRYHFLLGADWKLCTRKLGIDRGTFFRRVYRIEQKLSRVFRELERMACSRWTNTFMGRRAWEWRRIPRLAVPDPPFSPKGSNFRA